MGDRIMFDDITAEYDKDGNIIDVSVEISFDTVRETLPGSQRHSNNSGKIIQNDINYNGSSPQQLI